MFKKNANYSKLNNQHDLGDLYDCLMSAMILTLLMNKIFI